MEKHPFSMQHLGERASNSGLSRECVRFNDHLSDRTISCHQSADTFLNIRSAGSFDIKEEETKRKTTTLSRERLVMLNQSIDEAQRKQTSSKTREKIRRKEGLLLNIKKEEQTTSRTRERSTDLERCIAEAERKQTSSRTREQLKEKEERLQRMREESAIKSTTTRKRMLAIDRAIKEEIIRSKQIRASAESAIVTKERELSKMKEVNARKEVIKQVLREITRAQVTDLAFLLDCTGSMSSYISTVKKEIHQIVDNIRTGYPDVKLRVAFVGYRDHIDVKRIEKLEFTEDCSSFSAFLETIAATGGGDTAEDVFGGLEEAGNLNWNSPCRVLMHFSDAPCHGIRFHSFHDDVNDYDSMNNDADRRGLRIENLLAKLQQLNVRYYFGQINNSTDKMITVFREVSRDPNFPFMVNLSDVSKVCSAISECVSISISATVDLVTKVPFRKPKFPLYNGLFSIKQEENGTFTNHVARPLKPYVIAIDVEPDWDKLPKYEVESINATSPSSFNDIKKPLSTESFSRYVKIALQPFAEGGQRISFKGLDCSPSLRCPKEEVLKEFKKTGDTYEDYISILETHTLAELLANEFYSVNATQRISYLRVNVIKFKDRYGKEKLYTSESLLDNYEIGFQKWTNNTSFVNKDSYSDTIHAFSHWTYEKTNGYLMICDLQGVQKEADQYILTDPAIHCSDVLRFGTTNLGVDGMKKFFRTHTCNDVCRKLRLKQRR